MFIDSGPAGSGDIDYTVMGADGPLAAKPHLMTGERYANNLVRVICSCGWMSKKPAREKVGAAAAVRHNQKTGHDWARS